MWFCQECRATYFEAPKLWKGSSGNAQMLDLFKLTQIELARKKDHFVKFVFLCILRCERVGRVVLVQKCTPEPFFFSSHIRLLFGKSTYKNKLIFFVTKVPIQLFVLSKLKRNWFDSMLELNELTFCHVLLMEWVLPWSTARVTGICQKWKCQNAFLFNIGNCQIRKMPELEIVSIGNC